MSRVLISYSHKDRRFVRRLVDDLVTRLPEVDVSYDMRIQSGEFWAELLAAQIEQADVILVVLSPDYLNSAWATRELYVASARQLNKKARLLPLMVRPCITTGLLSNLTFVDFTENYETALETLIWGITGERPRAAKEKEAR